MKKFTRLFILAILGLCLVGVTYAQNWDNPSYDTSIISSQCQCALRPISPFAIYCIIGLLLLSVFMIPSWGILKKAGVKTRKSLIPIGNFYTLFGVATSKFWQLFSALIILLLFLIFIYGKFIYPISSYSHCCNGERIIWANLGIFILFLCILIAQFYCLARKFGLKKFSSILFALFFPIGVRILSFGNYEYIGNKENSKNLENK